MLKKLYHRVFRFFFSKWFDFCHWLWLKTSITLPLQREYMEYVREWYRKYLFVQHAVRDNYNNVHKDNLTTKGALFLSLYRENEHRPPHPVFLNEELVRKIREVRKN